MNSLRTYAAFGAVLVLAVLCFASYAAGRYMASTKCDLRETTAELKQTVGVVQANSSMQSAAAQTAVASAERHVQIVTRFQPIEKEVIRYVQTPSAADVCLDDDGLRIWAAANSGTPGAALTLSAGHAAVPEPTHACIRQGGGSAGQPCGVGQDVPGVPSTPERAGGSHQQGQTGD